MGWCYNCDDMEWNCMCGGDDYWDRPSYGSKNRGVPRGVHIMNGPEAKVMRRLKSDTGLTEEEIREVKKYRVELSTAQKEGEKAKRSKLQKLKEWIV